MSREKPASDRLDRDRRIDALLRTALHDTGGESIEGGFVDRYEKYCWQAVDALDDLFRRDKFTPADEDRIRQALRQPDVVPDNAVHLLVYLRQYTANLVDEMLGDQSPEVRAVAATSAVKRGDYDRWTRALDDPDPRVRLAAVTALATDGGRPYDKGPPLRGLLDDDDPEVRRVAIGCCGFIRDPEGAAALLRRLQIEPDDDLRRVILLRLGQGTAGQAYNGGGDRLVRAIGPDVRAALHQAVAHPDAEVRLAAAKALALLDGVEDAVAMLARLAVEEAPEVRRALTSRTPYHRISQQAFPVLSRLLAGDCDPVVRWQAAIDLRYCGPIAQPVLLAALGDGNAGVRREAAESLGIVGDRRVLPPLRSLLTDPASRRDVSEIQTAIEHIEQRHPPPPAASPPPVASPPVASPTSPTSPPAVSPPLPPAAAQGSASPVRHNPPALRPPSPQLSAWIERRIAQPVPPLPGDWPGRYCRETLQALPIHGNGVDLWAIRPDGTILCLDLDSVRHATDVETHPERRLEALVHGAAQFPELQALLPVRPANSPACPHCHATGLREAPDNTIICPACGGLGWRSTA